jgi:hypothetical protein
MALEVSWRPPVLGKKGQVSIGELGRGREEKERRSRRRYLTRQRQKENVPPTPLRALRMFSVILRVVVFGV